MSTATSHTAGRLTPSSSDRKAGRLAWWAGMVAVVGMVAFLVAWLLGWVRFTTDPRVLEIRQLQKEAREKFQATGGPSTMAEATETVTTMNQIRQRIEALPESLRQTLEREGGNAWRSMMRSKIEAYFAAPPEKRLAELDRHIQQQELMRKALEATSTGRGPLGGHVSASQGTADGQRPGTTPRSDEARQAFRKRILDTTTPQQRARYTEYRRAIDVRRAQLGLPLSGPPGWPR